MRIVSKYLDGVEHEVDTPPSIVTPSNTGHFG